MKKILEVNEQNLNNKNLISEWLTECQLNVKPCIIIYYHDNLAQITASLSHLMQDKKISVQLDEREIDKSFFFLGIKYFQNTLHFWQYNNRLFTFNDIDKEMAKQAATEIYQVLEKLVKIKAKTD